MEFGAALTRKRQAHRKRLQQKPLNPGVRSQVASHHACFRPNRRESSVFGRPPVEQGQNAGPPSQCGAVGGNPRHSSPVHRIATSICPLAEPTVTPKTPPGASGGLGSGHSIPIGDGAVGPSRSGFVLHLCIRKADEAGVRPRSVTALRIQDSAEDATGKVEPPECPVLT